MLKYMYGIFIDLEFSFFNTYMYKLVMHVCEDPSSQKYFLI